ncbi:hypothetical protein CTheo_8970 [Ceratobasidium theobromae]|uniref:Uncharacterized protein n=1 Tax=Ceratobasidium theobromae TaxID=1582974 RepID=A0A5N5Q721_9AGAM|nr:hypothetical protein CTheo_8970 [Ceratobasidium theobromae]
MARRLGQGTPIPTRGVHWEVKEGTAKGEPGMGMGDRTCQNHPDRGRQEGGEDDGGGAMEEPGGQENGGGYDLHPTMVGQAAKISGTLEGGGT